MRKINLLISFAFLCIFLVSCSLNSSTVPRYGTNTGNFVGDSGDASGILSINSLLILPLAFDANTREQSRNARIFYDALVNAFKSDLDMEISTDQRFLNDFNGENPGACLNFAKAKGPSYGSDAVLCTTLHQFKERRGSSLGSENPAELSFSMQILRISDGRSIWMGDFVFKDKALNENLLNLDTRISKRGEDAGWQSARIMIERGFHEASADFARRRLEKFAPGKF
ncbi:MAG: hypothetical protein GYA55_02965 [SAR324 cluster bacterium]|uniref:Lipoprotein n=1 Tax=SAR324 cluster bacterium TaxID=2024889 RepID=A0A7X9FQ31_9DELT|nr:hypothetical protein [SAR324 cluster bacterium]